MLHRVNTALQSGKLTVSWLRRETFCIVIWHGRLHTDGQKLQVYGRKIHDAHSHSAIHHTPGDLMIACHARSAKYNYLMCEPVKETCDNRQAATLPNKDEAVNAWGKALSQVFAPSQVFNSFSYHNTSV